MLSINQKIKYPVYKGLRNLKTFFILIYTTIVFFEKVVEIKTKNNDIMLVGDVSNGTSIIRFVIFSNDYNRLKNVINSNNLFLAIVTKSLSNKNEEQLVIKDLKKI